MADILCIPHLTCFGICYTCVYLKIYYIQTYGKGTAADCRKRVQKLNMMRAEKEQLENEQIQSSPCSHPPEDYANTFTAQEKQPEEIVRT